MTSFYAEDRDSVSSCLWNTHTSQSTHSCIYCKHVDLSNARCALILSPSRNLSGFSLSLPELLMENDTHGSELALFLRHERTHTHTETLKHLPACVCVCVAAQSRGRVGLWQLSLRRGCADQGWAENQGLAVLKGELHDSSPTWKTYLLAAASPTAPSPWSPRGRIHVCLTYPLTLCLFDLPPDCLSAWLNHWLMASLHCAIC